MRRLVQVGLLLLVAGAGWVAVTQPENLPFALPGNLQSGRTAAPSSAPSPEISRPAPDGSLTDAALTALVARQPISVQALRARQYPGSALTVRAELCVPGPTIPGRW